MVHRAMISNNCAGITWGLVRLDISWLASQSAERSTQVRPTTTVRAVPAVHRPLLCGCGGCATYGSVLELLAKYTQSPAAHGALARAERLQLRCCGAIEAPWALVAESGQFLRATSLPSCQPRARSRFPLPKQCRRSMRRNSARARDSQRHTSLAWDSSPVLRTSSLQTIPRNRSCIRSGS
jgi:hypothetical protein